MAWLTAMLASNLVILNQAHRVAWLIGEKNRVKYNINKHKMLLFYKIWKKDNEIQLTKNKMTLIFEKLQIIHPPQQKNSYKFRIG